MLVEYVRNLCSDIGVAYELGKERRYLELGANIATGVNHPDDSSVAYGDYRWKQSGLNSIDAKLAGIGWMQRLSYNWGRKATEKKSDTIFAEQTRRRNLLREYLNESRIISDIEEWEIRCDKDVDYTSPDHPRFGQMIGDFGEGYVKNWTFHLTRENSIEFVATLLLEDMDGAEEALFQIFQEHSWDVSVRDFCSRESSTVTYTFTSLPGFSFVYERLLKESC